MELRFGTCSSFVVVDPATLEWEAVQVEPDGPTREVNLQGIRAVVRSRADVLIIPHIHAECCRALQALAVTVYLAPEGLTVREAIERYRLEFTRQVAVGGMELAEMAIWLEAHSQPVEESQTQPGSLGGLQP